MYKLEVTNRFKQSAKKLPKRRKDGFNMQILDDVITMLVNGETLPDKYKNHPLKGNFKGFYDCHVLPDLVLVYKIEKEKLILVLFDIGSHSELF